MLTVLTPCVLPLLPVVIGSSASGRSRSTPYTVVGTLALSIIVFTYLLKVSTVFVMVPPEFWTYFSGGILGIFGLILLLPHLWEMIPGMARISGEGNKLVGQGFQRKNFLGDVLIGAALGPVFSSCSPTFFVILASVLPASFALGSLYLLSYTLGLSLVLLLIAVLGERFTQKLSTFSDPRSPFKRILGVIFIILGLLIATGYEKKLELALLTNGFYDFTKIEQKLLQIGEPEESLIVSTSTVNTPSSPKVVAKKHTVSNPYKEIVNPSGFVNTGGSPIKIADYVGKKVILLDIMTYSCINCQRTWPYVISWYEKYKNDGLIIIGIHTPEFAFEKDIGNVEKAMKAAGINFPIVLDNDYGTWNAYGNRYWPRKYLIDIYGDIVYDHIGEGAYEAIETKIKELLMERREVLDLAGTNGLNGGLVSPTIPSQVTAAGSPETYFGSLRNERLKNGTSGKSGEYTLTIPTQILPSYLYLGGTWNITGEYAQSIKDSVVKYHYYAKEVYIVAESDNGVTIEVWQDGVPVSAARGRDVNLEGKTTIRESKLYKLIKNDTAGEHTLELRVEGGARLFAFTFG